MSLRDILSPFYVWKRAFSKPYVVNKPLDERPGAPRYRGFHKNDMDKCIGCGTCSDICQNAAIDMVPVEGQETTRGDSGLRPKIDYGRCCWCALCVDVCTTGSLTMSNEYTWVDTDADVFRFVPGAEEKPWDKSDLGYQRAENYSLLHHDRVPMPMEDFDEGIQSFVEMVRGYSKGQAQREADRCVQCGICVAACPAHMDIPDYIKAVREGDLEEGLRLLYRTNPMSATCGRICTHKCEESCAMVHLGDAISIRWLKRYIIDQIPDSEFGRILGEEFAHNGRKVSIVGAGPGGLAAAYYLILMGYDVTIYEARSKAGGMLRYGVPEYRLPGLQLDRDIDHIVKLGVEMKYNTRVGEDIDFDKLYDDSDAVFIAIGLDQPYYMGIEGEDLPGVIPGLKLLDDVTEGRDPGIGKRVAVIGGGNVAMDACRVSRRLGSDVTLLYRRREEDMPADEEEVHDSKMEGVNIVTKAIPIRIEKGDPLTFVWGEAEMVDQGPGKRPNPVLMEERIHHDSFDTIISAIGQGGDFRFIPESVAETVKVKRGKISVHEWNRTGNAKVFAGGDIANSNADAISAIADGHRAARGIDNMLKGKI